METYSSWEFSRVCIGGRCARIFESAAGNFRNRVSPLLVLVPLVALHVASETVHCTVGNKPSSSSLHKGFRSHMKSSAIQHAVHFYSRSCIARSFTYPWNLSFGRITKVLCITKLTGIKSHKLAKGPRKSKLCRRMEPEGACMMITTPYVIIATEDSP